MSEFCVGRHRVQLAIRRAKLPANRHHQQTNIQFLQAGCPSCRPTNSVKALKEIQQYDYIQVIMPALILLLLANARV